MAKKTVGGWEMKEKHILLTELLNASIRGVSFEISKYGKKPIDWGEIYSEAIAHQVHTLIFPVVKKIDHEFGPDKQLMSIWNIAVMSCGIQMISDELWIGNVIDAFNAAGIMSIVLKGMAINKCYPYPELRTMGDADILVNEYDMDRATQILENMGYIAEKDKKTKHVEFFKKNFLSIELHRLLVDYDFIKNKENFHKEIWKDPVEIELGAVKAYSLSWDMQIIHLCMHMASHISYGGFGLRQLADFVMVVETKRDQLNWNIIKEKSIEYGISQFLYAIYAVCNRLFQIDIPPEIISRNENNDEKVQNLIEDILLGGNFGKQDIKRSAANVIINNTDKGEFKNLRNRFYRYIHILFPNRDLMSRRYKYIYVKKSPIFLPLAWIHRIAYGIKRKDFGFEDKKAIFRNGELDDIAIERNSLLEWLGIR